MNRNCGMTYYSLPETLDTIKICGMAPSSPIISKNDIRSLLVFASAKDFFTNSVSHFKGLDASRGKQTLCNGKLLKKVPRMDERSAHSTLGRRRSSFSTTYHLDADVGSQRPTTSCNFCFDSPKNRILWCNQPENGLLVNPKRFPIQCRHLSKFPSLSSSAYSRENTPYSGQGQLSQSTGSERIPQTESTPPCPYFSTAILPGSQSHRTSLENYSTTKNAQSLLRIDRKTRRNLNLTFFEMGATK